jgi:hypothetical protein
MTTEDHVMPLHIRLRVLDQSSLLKEMVQLVVVTHHNRRKPGATREVMLRERDPSGTQQES